MMEDASSRPPIPRPCTRAAAGASDSGGGPSGVAGGFQPRLTPEGFMLRSYDEMKMYDIVKPRIFPNLDFDEDLRNIGSASSALTTSSGATSTTSASTTTSTSSSSAMSPCALGKTRTVWTGSTSSQKTRSTTSPSRPSPGSLVSTRHRPSTKEALDAFWNHIADKETRVRGSIKNPIIAIFHRWLSARTTGRLDDTRVSDKDILYLYHTIADPRKVNPLPYIMSSWFTQMKRSSGRIAFGSYLEAIIYKCNPDMPMRDEYYRPHARISENLTTGTMVTGSDRKTYFVSGTYIELPCSALGLFIPGKADWLSVSSGRPIGPGATREASGSSLVPFQLRQKHPRGLHQAETGGRSKPAPGSTKHPLFRSAHLQR
ncbi:hypothetical protein SEVIR_5G257450v4 [Setaria viridis]